MPPEAADGAMVVQIRAQDRVLWLDHGRLLQDGPAPDVLAAYQDASAGALGLAALG